MVLKEGWVDKAIDWFSVVCLIVGVLSFVAFAVSRPGGLEIIILPILVVACLYMGIRGVCVIAEWLDK